MYMYVHTTHPHVYHSSQREAVLIIQSLYNKKLLDEQYRVWGLGFRIRIRVHVPPSSQRDVCAYTCMYTYPYNS